MLKVIVAGGRTFNDYPLLKRKLDAIFANQERVEIVSGAAKGADALGEQYAQERGWPVKRFPADWDLGRRAGPLRNAEMVAYATHLVAFPGGKGTADCIKQAKDAGLIVRMISGL